MIKHSKYILVVKLILLFSYLWLPSLMVLSTNHTQSIAEKIAVICFSLFILVCPLVYFKRVKYYFLFWTPLTLLIPPYLYLIIIFNSVPGDIFISAVIHTDIAHGLEVLGTFGWTVLWIPFLTMFYFLAASSIDNNVIITGQKNILAALLMYAMLNMVGRQTLTHSVNLPPLFEEYTALLTFPTSLVLSTFRVLNQSTENNSFITARGRYVGKSSSAMLVVLVIGESVRYDHLGLNGYSRKTTPLLSHYGTEIISFSDVTSTANWTYESVPNLISYPLKKGRISLIQTFKEAGFKTAWLSNQEVITNLSTVADISEYTTSDFSDHLRKDLALLPLFESFIHQAGMRQFIIFHMIGSHIPYKERYSADSKVFFPTLTDTHVSLPNKKDKLEAINSYDNTIIELDKFLARIISLLAKLKQPAVMLYTSDHGENLFDDSRQLFMHAQSVPTRYDIQVPLLIWVNQAYHKTYPDLFSILSCNRNKKISHTHIFPSILEMANIDWNGKSATESFASTQFTEKTRKLQSTRYQNIDELFAYEKN